MGENDGRELPADLGSLLREVARVLSTSPELVRKNVIQAESEQIVRSAYQVDAGSALSRADLFLRQSEAIPDRLAERAILFAEERAGGKLLQHLLGTQQFLDHEYEVGPEVLIPRPETEVLVMTAATGLSGLPDGPRLGLEIGIGSGIISIELLSRFPKLRMIASELTADARRMAQGNADRILGPEGVSRLSIVAVMGAGLVLEPFGPHLAAAGDSVKADFIISNPPYMIQGDEIDREVVDNEPHEALFAPGSDPLYFYRRIATGATEYLLDSGSVFMEIPSERGEEILSLFRESGWSAKLIPDLTGRNRILVAKHG